jgi:radical SAM protein with 4Fe4S-binding SPASM domain
MADVQQYGWNISGIFREQRRVQKIYKKWQEMVGQLHNEKINIFNPALSYPLGKDSSFFVKHARNWDNQLINEDIRVIPGNTGHCALMTDTFGILSDGTCTYCCTDYEGALNLGNANEQSLEDIYYGEKATKIREAEEKGRMIHPRCRECKGTLVYKDTRKPVPSRNMITDFYVFMDHFKRYGIGSAVKKVREAVHRRKWL